MRLLAEQVCLLPFHTNGWCVKRVAAFFFLQQINICAIQTQLRIFGFSCTWSLEFMSFGPVCTNLTLYSSPWNQSLKTSTLRPPSWSCSPRTTASLRGRRCPTTFTWTPWASAWATAACRYAGSGGEQNDPLTFQPTCSPGLPLFCVAAVLWRPWWSINVL